MEGFLALGFLIGMRHALEADHIAAVGSMVIGKDKHSGRALVLRGATWGLGHTLTLFMICAAALLFGLTVSDAAGAALEFAVGIMLVMLGLDVLRRLRKEKVHFHAHSHEHGKPHLHAHSHATDKIAHRENPHEHAHPEGIPIRALIVGLIHGAAGSGGLLVLAVAATQDVWTALGYVFVFGIGSILGMMALTFAASWPLRAAAQSAGRLHQGLTIGVAALTILLGIGVMVETAPVAAGVFS